MSRASKKRRKERSQDPHWVAVRTLLSLYGMKMSRSKRTEWVKDAVPPVQKEVGVYNLHKGTNGRMIWVGEVPEGASLDEWAVAVTKADRLEMIDLPVWGQWRSNYTAQVSKASAKIKQLWVSFDETATYRTAARLDQDARGDIQPPAHTPRLHGPQFAHRVAKARRPPRKIS